MFEGEIRVCKHERVCPKERTQPAKRKPNSKKKTTKKKTKKKDQETHRGHRPNSHCRNLSITACKPLAVTTKRACAKP